MNSMKTKWDKFLCTVLCVLLLSALLPANALAAGNIDTSRTADLTVEFLHEDTAVRGASFDLYFVSSVTAFFMHQLSGQFRDFDAQLTELDTEGWDTLANTLTALAQKEKYSPVETARTDKDGRILFDDLTLGLYLAVGHAVYQDNVRYTVKPFLVFLPGRDPVSKEWIYDVTMIPKSAAETVIDDTVTRKVLKVWDDNGCENLRPTEVTVFLLRDGQVFDTVTLNEANRWSHVWNDLEDRYEWNVMEDTTEYTVTVKQDGITFVVTNSMDPPEEPPPSDPPTTDPPTTEPPSVDPPDDDPPDDDPPIDIPNDPIPLDPFDPDIGSDPIRTDPKLPQTGLLWWPVPVLAITGLFLFFAGLIIRKRERDG